VNFLRFRHGKRVRDGCYHYQCNGGRTGSLVVGSATVATAWITQRTLSKRELLGVAIRARETFTVSSFATSRRSYCRYMISSIAFGFAHPTRFLRKRN
jgi:hypothetical protein